MNTVNTITTASEASNLLGVGGALIAMLTVPMWLGVLRRNSIWGARTPTAMASDRNWEVVNRATGRVGALWGAFLVCLAWAVSRWVPEGLPEVAYNLLVAVPFIALGIHITVAARRAGRPLRQRLPVRHWPAGMDGPPAPLQPPQQ